MERSRSSWLTTPPEIDHRSKNITNTTRRGGHQLSRIVTEPIAQISIIPELPNVKPPLANKTFCDGRHSAQTRMQDFNPILEGNPMWSNYLEKDAQCAATGPVIKCHPYELVSVSGTLDWHERPVVDRCRVNTVEHADALRRKQRHCPSQLCVVRQVSRCSWVRGHFCVYRATEKRPAVKAVEQSGDRKVLTKIATGESGVECLQFIDGLGRGAAKRTAGVNPLSWQQATGKGCGRVLNHSGAGGVDRRQRVSVRFPCSQVGSTPD